MNETRRQYGLEAEQDWERQPGESDKAFAAFIVYRDLPANKGSLDEVGRQLYSGPQSERKRAATGRSSTAHPSKCRVTSLPA